MWRTLKLQSCERIGRGIDHFPALGKLSNIFSNPQKLKCRTDSIQPINVPKYGSTQSTLLSDRDNLFLLKRDCSARND